MDPHTGAASLSDPPLQGAKTAWKERRGILWEWVLAIVLALSAALLIRALFFEAFRIPSESMENTLLVGDFVLVSKLHYGPRLPVTLGLPFTNVYADGIEMKPRRLPGFGEVQRQDVIVFNVPTEQFPIDRRTHYIKRVIGLPGDSLLIENKVPVIGNETVPIAGEMKQRWRAYMAGGIDFPLNRLKDLGVYQFYLPKRRGDPVDFEASSQVAQVVGEWEEVTRVEPHIQRGTFRSRIFPRGSQFSMDNYGPLYIPRAGDEIFLTDDNWSSIQEIIVRFEGHSADRIGPGVFRIDGEEVRSYTVEQDYYFVMGDNRDSSLDSRIWGFVPASHIVGKAVMVYFSWDPQTDKARFNRFLSGIN